MMKMQSLRRKMYSKIRSNRGASLSFALLLFLVCTVVGSVVLAAGTASAGRMSKLGESDQSYYSVTSAAQFLAKELSDKDVKIVRTYEETTETEYEISSDESLVRTGTPPTVTSVYTTVLQRKLASGLGYEDVPGQKKEKTYVNKAEADQEGQPFFDEGETGSFLSERAIYYLLGPTGTCNNYAAMNASFAGGIADDTGGTFTIEHTYHNDILKITGKYKVNVDGTIVLTLWDVNNRYSLAVTLQPDFDENTRSYTRNEPATLDDPSTGIYKSKTIRTTIKESTVFWKLGSITKNSSTA